MRALAIAATGMNAQQLNVEVIANNISNLNTTAFKAARAEFKDLIYQAERPAGVPIQAGESAIPEGAMLGLGVRNTAIRNLHRQGPLTNTTNPLDLALNGRGWFQITMPNGEINYTRAGSFNKNADGRLVSAEGYSVDPAIIIPQNAVDVVINETGQVMVKVDAQPLPQTIGQLQLANFTNDAGLEPLGNGLYRETPASGLPVTGFAGDPGFGKLQQGYLETSNVDPVREITNLISAQRAFEMNSKVIQAADEMAGTISKGIR
ncbi:flagellar basal-body rod protein FlgG [Methylobacterium longum]|uniref:Flagellar basal-body rod protein FlgG n=1 Tax=Methylobacterium longum TaxID=767694 RepID=A0ABT8AQI2_9HYPH|nr:flagellar basal-body rod protein FlgG [Methylobacterium longum]MDN3571670.1 flagellar basal-body rod protein FlgG [Methylobacterium longum]GJE11666.1 Flagellar basal-body rod protein FlgG [Methylobacterium longum]